MYEPSGSTENKLDSTTSNEYQTDVHVLRQQCARDESIFDYLYAYMHKWGVLQTKVFKVKSTGPGTDFKDPDTNEIECNMCAFTRIAYTL